MTTTGNPATGTIRLTHLLNIATSGNDGNSGHES